MCNKTCAMPLPPDVIGHKTGKLIASPLTPNKKGSSWDTCTMFPPATRIWTPQELAAKRMMEDKLALQEREKQAVAVQVQMLWEKFTAAANEKYLTTKEKEVHWWRLFQF
jgi:hypothetical protein